MRKVHRRAFAGLLAIAVSSIASAVWAGDSAGKQVPLTAVLELFTSQGCSSCPPADALLQRYVNRDDIIALSLPVDYWDYLGWKDTFGSPAHSARQRAYASRRGDGLVYTPQIVVNGMAHAVGSRQKEIEQAIAATQKRFAGNRIPVSIRENQAGMVVELGAPPAGAQIKDATVWLAVVTRAGKVEVQRGENGGRDLTYFSVVRRLTQLAHWSGSPVAIDIPRSAMSGKGADGCIVLLQQGTDGPIIGGARLWNRQSSAVAPDNQQG